ncbi:hypothetical protein T05_6454 [Trichinella murrelli]|uniref:Uncharacterized protein n=1 Tax=Trichinella murrelli TaxID=144512 RepID=A0A0V0UDA1_9BILA|nr:hypothetical protein T05_6454 [Trichinella murrelli]
MYNCLTYVTCTFDNDHNQNMLKQPLHLVICLPLRTAVSGNPSVQRIQLKDKKYTLNKRTEFQEGLLLIQASFAVCISKYKFNE